MVTTSAKGWCCLSVQPLVGSVRVSPVLTGIITSRGRLRTSAAKSFLAENDLQRHSHNQSQIGRVRPVLTGIITSRGKLRTSAAKSFLAEKDLQWHSHNHRCIQLSIASCYRSALTKSLQVIYSNKPWIHRKAARLRYSKTEESQD